MRDLRRGGPIGRSLAQAAILPPMPAWLVLLGHMLARLASRACSSTVRAGDSSTRRSGRCLHGVTHEVDGMNSGNPDRVRRADAMATLSQAGGAPPEGAETTWGLGLRPSALNDRQERPAPEREVAMGRHREGEEIVRSRGKSRGKVNPLVQGSNPCGPTTFRCTCLSPWTSAPSHGRQTVEGPAHCAPEQGDDLLKFRARRVVRRCQ